MKKYILAMAVTLTAVAAQAKTLIVYYSYTNNVERIVTELRNQIEADVIEVATFRRTRTMPHPIRPSTL